jgi:hypothetical protein
MSDKSINKRLGDYFEFRFFLCISYYSALVFITAYALRLSSDQPHNRIDSAPILWHLNFTGKRWLGLYYYIKPTCYMFTSCRAAPLPYSEYALYPVPSRSINAILLYKEGLPPWLPSNLQFSAGTVVLTAGEYSWSVITFIGTYGG